MKLIDAQHDPSPRQWKVLGLALCALGGLGALLIWLAPERLVIFIWVTGLAWGASMLFNSDEPVSRQWKGAVLPIVVGLAHAAVRLTGSPAAIAVAVMAVLEILGLTVWFHDQFGNRFHETWSQLFLPLAWSVSTLLLTLVFYGVLTPIGLTMRILGRDPMHREFDRARVSYWIKRREMENAERCFRQF